MSQPRLNYRNTLCVGFAFFLITAFWQAYDNIIPMILTEKFGMTQTWSGFIMALDNILALFLLPLFGTISDRTKTRLGRRTPFILAGTIISVCALMLVGFVDAAQLRLLEEISAVDDPAALTTIYVSEAGTILTTPTGESVRLSEQLSEEEFVSIGSLDESGETSADYTNYVLPARQAYANRITRENPRVLILFIALLLILLVAMASFRSPAVALMPDVTIKPLRSKANAMINLMGAVGGILVLVLGMLFQTSSIQNALMTYRPYLLTVAFLMAVALLLFMLTVREPALVEQMHRDSVRYGYEEETKDEAKGTSSKLQKEERRSMGFLLASIVLWFMGYNAVTSKYSVYATTILHQNFNLTLIIAQVTAILSYMPVGIIASHIGRKKTILAGIVILAVSFGIAATLRADSPALIMNFAFATAGIGWATINVNSFPMVVEMCSSADVGKYTGIYYTASMAAQITTPILSGMLMDRMGMLVLFVYATILVCMAFGTMSFVRHGDSKPISKQGLEALDVDVD